MKNFGNLILTIMLLSMFSLGSIITVAQTGAEVAHKSRDCKHSNIPDLTAEQQKKIDDLHFAFMKKMKNNRNLLAEKQAHLNTLRTADKVNMNAINKTIDEIGTVRTKILKAKEAYNQEIRSVLNEQQRLYYDSHRHKFNGRCNGYRHGNRAYHKRGGRNCSKGYGQGCNDSNRHGNCRR